MAFVRPFGQAPQGASPWSAGMPPGLQQQQPQAPAPQQHQAAPQVAQQMFNQPMGAFDISGGGANFSQSGPAQMAPAAGQWAQPMQAMQAPIQFVTNAGPFMHQPIQPHLMQPRFVPQQQQFQQHQQQHQRSMNQQRSLSASRVGSNQNNRRFNNNQNNNFGGGQWQPNNRQQQNNNNNNSNNNNQFKGSNRAQSRPQQNQNPPQKGQQSKASNNNNGNNTNNNKQQQQQQAQNQQKQAQQTQQKQQKPQQGATKVVVKVTKAAKKQAVAKANKVSKPNAEAVKAPAVTNDSDNAADKPRSRTAERKQLKLQARKNAESLKLDKMPISKASKSAVRGPASKLDGNANEDNEAPIDQSQLKCVPAVFGFVCRACEIFLRDRFSRREHIDSESHMEKFKAYEIELKRLESEKEAAAAAAAADATAAAATTTSTVEVKSEPKSDDDASAAVAKTEGNADTIDGVAESEATGGDGVKPEPDAAEA